MGERAKNRPDSKAMAILRWLDSHLKTNGHWNGKRVILSPSPGHHSCCKDTDRHGYWGYPIACGQYLLSQEWVARYSVRDHTFPFQCPFVCEMTVEPSGGCQC